MTQTDRERKFFKIVSVLDAVIMSTFLALNTITNFRNRDIWLTAAHFVVSAVVMILANLLVYQYFKKKTI